MNGHGVSDVLRFSEAAQDSVRALLARYGIELLDEQDGADITGSFWGDDEAGVAGNTVFVRNDTPLHSLLHETCHIICMSGERRAGLLRDAGGDDLEESAVCFLQIVLADWVDGVGRDRLMQDMDSWGYSFRLGSTGEWFRTDAEDAEEFLLNHGLLHTSGAPTFQLRE